MGPAVEVPPPPPALLLALLLLPLPVLLVRDAEGLVYEKADPVEPAGDTAVSPPAAAAAVDLVDAAVGGDERGTDGAADEGAEAGEEE